MQSNIYRVCCCLNGYYNSNYQEIDDSDIKLKSAESINLNSAGVGAGYRSVVISNPSSSSFEPETSENEDTEGKGTNLNTDLYNTNNLNTMNTDNSKMQKAAVIEDTAGNNRSPPAFAIESEVSNQLTSWQSASFAMAHASRSTTAKNNRNVDKSGTENTPDVTESTESSYTGRIRSRNSSNKAKKRPKNEIGGSSTAAPGNDSSLERMREKMNRKPEEKVPVTAGTLFKSLLSKGETGSSIERVKHTRKQQEHKETQEFVEKEQILKDNVEDDELSDLDDFSSAVSGDRDGELGDSPAPENGNIPHQPTVTATFQPIQRLWDVFSGSIGSTVTESPFSEAITQETSIKFEDIAPEKTDDLSDIDDSEVYDSLVDSEVDEATSYSIATSDISTDPTTENEEEPIAITEAFFPEVHNNTKPLKNTTATDVPGQPNPTKTELSSTNSRYPTYKQTSGDESSSIATDDLSTSIDTDDLDTQSSVQDTSSDYENISGRTSGLEVGSVGDGEDGTKGEGEEIAPNSRGQYIGLDKETGQFIHYDDPNLIETDSAFSFPGRISLSEENGIVGIDTDELRHSNENAKSPVPSMEESSTIVTGVSSSGGDTLTEMSVSRAGAREEDVVEVKKRKKSGLVSRIKKRVMKK